MFREIPAERLVENGWKYELVPDQIDPLTIEEAEEWVTEHIEIGINDKIELSESL